MASNHKYKRIVSAVQILFVFFVTIVGGGIFAPLGVDMHHAGVILKPASDIAHGQMLFRDTFSQYGALATIIQSWALTIFGHYYIVINYLTVFFYGLIAVLLWLVWSLFIPELLATAACIIWFLLASYFDYTFLPWPSVYALFFQLVTMYTLLKFYKTKKNIWQCIAGITLAFTFWSRQPVGIFIFLSISIYFVTLRIKKFKSPSIKPFFISLITVHTFFLIWLLINNAFSDWYFQTIRYTSIWATSTSKEILVLIMRFFENMFAHSFSPISIWTVLPLITLYLGFKIIKTKKLYTLQALVLLTVYMNLFSWLQYYPINDLRHLYWAAAPMIGFIFYLALNVDKNKGSIFLIICFLLFLPDVLYNVRLARRKIRKFNFYPTLTRPSVLRGMKTPPEEKKFYDETMNALDKFKKTHSDSFITTTGTDAFYSLFDGGNKNCYKLTADWLWERYDAQVKKDYDTAMITCIEKYKPAVFTQEGHYIPRAYVRVTKEMSQTGNYLLLPME